MRTAARTVGAASVAVLDADEALSAVLAARHASAAAFAVELEALARLAEVYPETDFRSSYQDRAVVFEVMAALGISQRSAATRLSLADGLAEVPALGTALREGTVDVSIATIVLDKITNLPPDLRAEAVDRLLAAHAQVPDGLTRAQLIRLLGRIVAALDPDRAEDEQADAVKNRRVWHTRGSRAGEESTLGMTGPSERVALCADTIDALARAILDQARQQRPDDGQDADRVCPASATLEQARFDALDWLVTGRSAASHPVWPPTDTPGDGAADEPAARAEADAEADGDPQGDADGPGPGRGSQGAAGSGAPVVLEPGSGTGEVPRGGETPGGGEAPRRGGCDCGRPQVRVIAQVTLSLATLLGFDDAPGELAGHGSIPPRWPAISPPLLPCGDAS